MMSSSTVFYPVKRAAILGKPFQVPAARGVKKKRLRRALARGERGGGSAGDQCFSAPFDMSLSVRAIASALSRNTTWMMVCHIKTWSS
jgi:hypothetical protein